LAIAVFDKLSLGLGPPPDRMKVPSHFYQAFMSIVIFVTGFQPKEERSHRFHRYLREASIRIEKGLKQLVQDSASEGLSDLEAVLPIGVLGLVVNRLLQDITYSQPDLLAKAYRGYIIRLVSRRKNYLLQVYPY
jgi:hypothetical protein